MIHKYWKPSNICCVSGELLNHENIDVKVGYWLPYLWKPVRKDLKSWCNKYEKSIIITPNTCHPQNQNCFQHIRLDCSHPNVIGSFFGRNRYIVKCKLCGKEIKP